MIYKHLVVIFVFTLAFFVVIPAISRAGTADNVSGFAWSENIGWVSFNCTDQGTCGSVDYGVNVRDDGFLAGYAWTDTIGWISFNLADTGAPPGEYNFSSSGFIAKYDLATDELRGWARALSGMDDPADGWDGWIKLFKHPSDTGADYGVIYNQATQEFENWAWGSDVVGWVSFNCKNQGTCGTSDYKVVANINQPPSASSLTVAKEDYCLVPSHTFSWSFSDPEDSSQTSYSFQVDNNSDFSSPEVNVSGGSSPSLTEGSVDASIANPPLPWKLLCSLSPQTIISALSFEIPFLS